MFKAFLIEKSVIHEIKNSMFAVMDFGANKT